MNKVSFLKYLRVFNRGMFVLGLVLLGIALVWQWNHRVDSSAIQKRAKAIAEREGIVIGLGSPETFFVPPYTAVDARLFDRATTVNIDAVPPALDGIEAALHVYPPGFFREQCKAIFLCGSLTCDGVSAGGTWRKEWIIISANEKYGLAGIREVAWHGVHHEFSSLIWRRFPELWERWNELLSPSWAQARHDSEALKASGDLAADPVDGFLSPYGATNQENDFNVYAETVFTNPSHVALQAEKHPIVAKKLALLVKAYIQLDKRFEGVFDGLHLLRFRSTLPAPFKEGIQISPSCIPQGQLLPSTTD